MFSALASAPDLAVLAGDIVLCSWARHLTDRIKTLSGIVLGILPGKCVLTCKAYRDVQSSASSLQLVDDSKGSRSSREFPNRNEHDNDQLDHNKQPMEI